MLKAYKGVLSLYLDYYCNLEKWIANMKKPY